MHMIVPKVGDPWGAMWNANWDWAFTKAQIDWASQNGANGVRIGFPIDLASDGGAAWTSAVTHMQQYLDYCASLGLVCYMVGAYQNFGGRSLSALAVGYGRVAAVLAPYPNVIGIDVANEINWTGGAGSVANARAWMDAFTPAVRANCSIPLTYSLLLPDAASWGTANAYIDAVADYADFMDFHPYYGSTNNPAVADVNNWRSHPRYKGGFLIGECGLTHNYGNVAMAARWHAIGLILALPDCFGATGFCVEDYDTVETNKYGIFEAGMINERTEITAEFATWARFPRITPLARSAPSAPTNLSSNAGNNAVGLVWSAPPAPNQPTGYKIYRGTSAGSETLLATIGNVLNYTDNTAVNGTTYFYKVAGTNSGGDGPQSNEVSATPAAPAVHYLSLPAASGAYADTPNTAANNPVGDLDLQAAVALNSATPAAIGAIVGKWSSTATDQHYLLYVDTAGKLVAGWRSVSATKTATSTVAVGAGLTSKMWVRATIQVNTPLNGWTVNFYTAPDNNGSPGAWTQLGTTVTSASGGGGLNQTGTKSVEIGSTTNGTQNLLAGKVYRVRILSGVNGTAACDIDFQDDTSGATTSVASTGETWTLHGAASIV